MGGKKEKARGEKSQSQKTGTISTVKNVSDSGLAFFAGGVTRDVKTLLQDVLRITQVGKILGKRNP